MKPLPVDDQDVPSSFSSHPCVFPIVPAIPALILLSRLPLLVVDRKPMVASWDLRQVRHGSVASCVWCIEFIRRSIDFCPESGIWNRDV
jgi:hypothetical protein